MNRSVLVSVVIPAFNSSDFIVEALMSVVNQTYKNIEIILVDDGSTDDTALLIKRVDFPIRYIFQKNQGSAVARNVGVDLALGKYIAFLDADDLWVHNKLELQVDTLESKVDSFVCFGIDMRVDQSFMLDDTNSIAERKDFDMKLSGMTLDKAIIDCPYHINNLLVKKQFLLQHNIRFSEFLKKGQDSSFIYQICANTSIIYLNTVLSFYRDNKSSITYSLSKVNYRKLVLKEAFQYHAELLNKDYNITGKMREFLFYKATYQHAYHLYYNKQYKHTKKLLRPLILKYIFKLPLYKLYFKSTLKQLCSKYASKQKL